MTDVIIVKCLVLLSFSSTLIIIITRKVCLRIILTSKTRNEICENEIITIKIVMDFSFYEISSSASVIFSHNLFSKMNNLKCKYAYNNTKMLTLSLINTPKNLFYGIVIDFTEKIIYV